MVLNQLTNMRFLLVFGLNSDISCVPSPSDTDDDDNGDDEEEVIIIQSL
jgi:hypothetical protein